MMLRPLMRRLRRALAYTDPLITVSISKERLLRNLRAYREAYPDLRIAPVLKSNAYGHGLTLVAELLDKEGVAFFMVDSLFEAKALRRSGIRSRILVMGYVRPEYIADRAVRDTDYAIVDLEQLRELSALAHKAVRVHLELDTGMHRNGILPRDLGEAIALARSNPHIRVVGVGAHLADADNPDPAFTNRQLSAWRECLKQAEAAFPSLEYRHTAATKGVRFRENAPMDTARIGMGLFGYDTSPGTGVPLTPVLSLRSSITSLREIPAGDSVGYNAAFTAARPSRIATVPVGYFEGLDRRLSNQGAVLVRGQACPIAGRVSMNMVSIDVTDVPEADRGDEVLVISHDAADPNSVASIARLCGDSPYVILAHIPAHLRRTAK